MDNNIIDLVKLNGLILNFEYCFFDKNDLPKRIEAHHINAEATLNLTAGQMMTLVINLPLILGNVIKSENENWHNFLRLHQIINIAFSFTYEDETVNKLKELITHYINNFKKLYKSISITPKIHYLTHLPEQLKNYGPLRHSACFRMEAKNGLIKGMNFKCFKNLSFSIATHHQFWLAGRQRDAAFKSSLAYTDDVCRVYKKMENKHTNLKYTKFISKISYLKKNGFQYKDGFCLILNDLNIGDSVGLIVDILNVDDTIKFYLKECKIIKFINHINCFEIKPLENYCYKNYSELVFKNAQYCLNYNGSLILQVRYTTSDNHEGYF